MTGSLFQIDLPTVFRCAIELVEAASTLSAEDWVDLPTECQGPGSPHHERQIEVSRRLCRIGEESERLKRSLGATGPLQYQEPEPSEGPKWENFDQKFNNTSHDRVARMALVKLATSAIDLSGFATWRELQWHMQETGIRLLGWGLEQLWLGMGETDRSSVRSWLSRSHKAVGWPVNPTSEPGPYEGPEEIPLADQNRIISNYVACRSDHLNNIQNLTNQHFEQRQDFFLRRATPNQFIEVASRAIKAIQGLSQNRYETAAEWADLYQTAFDSLACLRKASEISPREDWSPEAIKHRNQVAKGANLLLSRVGGPPETKAGMCQEEVGKAFEQMTEATRNLRNTAIRTNGLPLHRSDDVTQNIGAKAVEPASNASLTLVRIFTNGIADDRIEKATRLVADNNLSVNEKLNKIDALIPFPPTASAEQLSKMLSVTKQAVLKTNWWMQNRKGEKESEVGRRQDGHRKRAKCYETPDQYGDDE